METFLSTYNPAEVIWIANTGLTYNIHQRGTVFVCHVDNNSVYTQTKILIVRYFYTLRAISVFDLLTI